MRRKSTRRAMSWCVRAPLVAVLCAGCGAGPIGGPDPAPATFFKASMVDGSAIPFAFRFAPADLALTYLTEARLVPLDVGRTTDSRIFENRGGSGSSSGNGRDTTVSTGRMADIRTFATAATGGASQTDSNVVDVVRVGDTLFITRPHPDPTRNVTDTALYDNGYLVRPLGYWRSVIERPTGRRLIYTTVR